MNKNKMTVGLLLIIIGLMMIISPVECLKVIVVLIGAVFFVNGLFNLTKLRVLIDEPLFRRVITARGIFCLLIGLAAMLLPVVFVRAVGAVISTLMYVLAIALFIAAAAEIFALLQSKDDSVKMRPYIIEIASSIAVAIVLLILGPNIETKLTIICGTVLLLIGAGMILYEYKTRPIIVEPDSVRDIADSEIED